jgi:hypothetical protein
MFVKEKKKEEKCNVHQPILPTRPNPPSNSSSLYQSLNSIPLPLYLILHLHLYRCLLRMFDDDLGKLLGVRMDGARRYGIQSFLGRPLSLFLSRIWVVLISASIAVEWIP